MNFDQVVERLRNDWSFVSSFMDDPVQALGGANLSADERQALTSRNVRSLISLGVRADQAVGAFSGCHRAGSVVPPTRLR